jgi:hypothetical protein
MGLIIPLEDRRLAEAMQAKNAPPPPPRPKPAVNSAAEIPKKGGKLLSDARDAEKQGNLPDALNDYAMVLKLQPGNQDAQKQYCQNRAGNPERSGGCRQKRADISNPVFLPFAVRRCAETALMDYLESAADRSEPRRGRLLPGSNPARTVHAGTPRTQWKGPSVEAHCRHSKGAERPITIR